ncbi:MAG: type VI secretion system tube protein Hcp [Planctomycetes bacterium]|nr:type VI secretion system tube protein Hcp [Planctomycetota bacterium]
MTILLRYGDLDGEGIKGSASFEKYNGWIELRSLELGGGRKIAMTHDGNWAQAENLPFLSEIVATKRCDRSSPPLFQASLQGSALEIEVHLLGSSGKDRQMELRFEQARIATYRLQIDDGDPIEHLTLVYTSIEMTFRPSSPEEQGLPNITMSYTWNRAR